MKHQDGKWKKENRKNETDIGGVAVIGSISDIKVV